MVPFVGNLIKEPQVYRRSIECQQVALGCMQYTLYSGLYFFGAPATKQTRWNTQFAYAWFDIWQDYEGEDVFRVVVLSLIPSRSAIVAIV